MTTTTMDDAAPFTSPSTGSAAGPPSARAGSQGSQVSIQGVHKVFRRRGQTVEALRSVDLDIERGEFVSLLGPSRVREVDAAAGDRWTHRTRRRHRRHRWRHARPRRAQSKQFGLVPQTPALVPWATVEKNVKFLSKLDSNRQGGHAPLTDDEVDELLDTVGLGRFRTSYPHELSGGMQQRVSLVRAFAARRADPADGRAVRRARRDHPRGHAVPAARPVGADGHDGGVRHPLDHRGRDPVGSGRGDGGRPGRIAAIEPIGLGRPRVPAMEDTAEFHEHVRVLRTQLRTTTHEAHEASRPDPVLDSRRRAGADPVVERTTSADGGLDHLAVQGVDIAELLPADARRSRQKALLRFVAP